MSSEKESVLIVDDAASNINLLVDLLAPEYDLFVATDGHSAIEIASNQELSIILLDVMMPDMDGYEVCRRLKDCESTSAIPIIFLTAMSEESNEAKGLGLGAVDYITKPFNPALVKARVKAHVSLFRSSRELLIERNKLDKAYSGLQRLEKLRDNLVQMIVHDLRSPLMGIFGNIDLALESLKEREPVSELPLLENAKLAAWGLNDMITTVLDLSRLEAGAMPVSISEVNLSVLVRSIADNLRNYNGSHRWIEVNSPDECIVLNTDSVLVERIITNLMSNALKYTPVGKMVELSVTSIEMNVIIRITDSGPGIPKEYQEKVFEKFGQVENGASSKKYSSGIGLTFCKLAVEALKGSISLRSEMGIGSVFTVILPR